MLIETTEGRPDLAAAALTQFKPEMLFVPLYFLHGYGLDLITYSLATEPDPLWGEKKSIFGTMLCLTLAATYLEYPRTFTAIRLAALATP